MNTYVLTDVLEFMFIGFTPSLIPTNEDHTTYSCHKAQALAIISVNSNTAAQGCMICQHIFTICRFYWY
jgi:hypothetical protein